MIKKCFKTTFVFTAAVISLTSFCRKDGSIPPSTTGENMINIIESSDRLQKIIDSSGDKLLVIDLYADWCVPCKILSPMLSEIALEMKGKAHFYQINLDKNPEAGKIFNVPGIPLVVLIKNKTAVDAIQGLASKGEYIRTINSHIEDPAGKNDAIPDGEIINGVRTIKLTPEAAPGDIYVYRGEEVKLVIDELKYPYSIHIPAYNISAEGTEGKKMEIIFKADQIGVFPVFCNGKCPSGNGSQVGRVVVMQFKTDSNTVYVELSAVEAKKLIEEKKPLILDVRTPNEFYEGHINGAILIPLQQLEDRMSELSAFKNKDILVYCRSGNRSTVASQIIKKHGFKKIYNLRSGMKGWIGEGYEYSR
ncbi:MAG: rhodanese-like domain-containing protein [Spirochaetes bacterium]|nr:rhodanese-like domain-containing protein [Spirochaetota bacterium]